MIRLRGVRTHNLKNIDLDLPKGRLIVITGPSGSGKSSLAFDTLYAEGQRRYVESLSPYARQFLERLERPDADGVEGLSPAIAIDQKRGGWSPRSTVATVSEVYDFLRLLFARVGTPYCPLHRLPLEAQTVSQMVDAAMARFGGRRVMVLAPVVRGQKGEYRKLFERLLRQGFLRVRVDGDLYELDDPPRLDSRKRHTIEVVVDRLRLEGKRAGRLAESIEIALKLTEGLVLVVDDDDRQLKLLFSANHACPECGFAVEALDPGLFSFNSPKGACRRCGGLGLLQFFDPEKIARNPPWWLKELWSRYGYPPETRFTDLPEPLQGKLIERLARRYRESDSDGVRERLGRLLSFQRCPDCLGTRLNERARSVRVGGRDLPGIVQQSVGEALDLLRKLQLTGRRREIASPILAEIEERLLLLQELGLDHLTLDRPASSLSGGEMQRLRLAKQLGSKLSGVLYVLDEPSIGLHPRDHQRLIAVLQKLRDLGNTVVVVEHDEATIRAADHIVDLGPGAGRHGGQIVAQGTPEEIMRHPRSLTGAYLSGRKRIELPTARRSPKEGWLILHGARGNNLKNITVRFPLGLLIGVTGVSGSGKSTLVHGTLYPALLRELGQGGEPPLPFDALEGAERIDRVVLVDQSPIGRTPRSNPATYTGVFTPVRELFASTPEAKARGWTASRFSFNLKGGRCEACQGEGLLKVEMHFLPDLHVVCDVCRGKRYGRETLEVRYRGKSIADVLEMTVEEALHFFQNIPQIADKLKLLNEIGLGYLQLGQSATTLSGGEAQRLKLARELAKRPRGHTLYLLDEPTTGLHLDDIKKLIGILFRLRSLGHTVIVIEHQLDVIKCADWIIDLGPEGGARGGEIVAEGPPEEIACSESPTGKFLK